MCNGDHTDSLLSHEFFDQMCANAAARIIELDI